MSETLQSYSATIVPPIPETIRNYGVLGRQCVSCKHGVDFQTEAEANRFTNSSGWIMGAAGWVCCVCQDLKVPRVRVAWSRVTPKPAAPPSDAISQRLSVLARES